jgi:hypothetical protein
MEPEGSLLCWAQNWFLFWARRIQSKPFHPISRRSVLTVSSHLRLGLPSGLTVCISHVSHTCYMPRSSHPPWFDRPNNILWGVQVMRFLIMQSSPASHHFPLRSSATCQTPWICTSPCVRDRVSHAYKTMGKISVLYTIIFKLLDRRREDKRFWTER